MSTIVNAGRDISIMNVSVTTSDTAISITTGYTPATPSTTPISGYTAQVINNVNTILIRCRTSVDMQLRKNVGDTNYWTIPAGTTLTLDISPTANTPGTINPFYLRSASGTVTAEILLAIE